MQPPADADGPVAEEAATALQALEPDCRLEALRLAVGLYIGRHGDDDMVVRAAQKFAAFLGTPVPPSAVDEITTALTGITATLATVNRKLDTVMSQQADIDAATAALTALTGDVATNVAQLVNTDIPAIQAALAALPSTVDTTALDAAVAAAAGTATSLDSSVSSVTALTPPAAPLAAPSGTSN